MKKIGFGAILTPKKWGEKKLMRKGSYFQILQHKMFLHEKIQQNLRWFIFSKTLRFGKILRI